jgi:putative component of membrane protein insertase Oxa1/YidC/SpoIIIJ protein YidD
MIWFYQQFISPRKGYRCAHSVVHGGTGCSGYAKHRIRDVGLLSAIPDIRQRLKDCSATASERRQSGDGEGRRRKNRAKRDGFLDNFVFCEGVELCGNLDGCGGCDGLDGCGACDGCS